MESRREDSEHVSRQGVFTTLWAFGSARFNETTFNLFFLFIGILLTSIMLILLGFIIVSRVQGVNGYMLGMIIGFLGLSFPPLLNIFGLFENPIFYLWPTQASFLLFEAVFVSNALESWEIIYGIGYQILWIAILYFLAKKTFQEYIIIRGG